MAGYSPLRPRGDTFDELDVARMKFGPDQDVARGIARTATGMTASGLFDEALRREVAREAGWEERRDDGLATQRVAGEFAPRVSSLRDVNGLGGLVDFAQGAGPGAAVSTLPALGVALLTRGAGLRSAPFAGAAVPSYFQSRGEIAGEQYSDPILSQASVEDRDRVATIGGGVSAALESVLPGNLANNFFKVPTRSFARNTLVDASTEALTEAGQAGVQQIAANRLDPTRGVDGWDLADSAASGFLGGGGLSAAMRAPGAVLQRFGGTPAEPADPAAPLPAAPIDDPGAPPGTPLPAAPRTMADDISDRAGEIKDTVADFVGRAVEAGEQSTSPSDFISRVFPISQGEQAEIDSLPEDQDPAVLNAANPEEALGRREAERQQSAQKYAQQLMDDPTTPVVVREHIMTFDGTYADPGERSFVFGNATAQIGGRKMAGAINSATDASASVVNRVRKNNLQDLPTDEIRPLVEALASRLGAAAGDAPQLARQLLALSARLSEGERSTPKLDQRLRNLNSVIDDEMLDVVTATAGNDGLRAAMTRIREIPSASNDVRKASGNSFLESLLVKPMQTPGQLEQLANLVDDAGLKLTTYNPTMKSRLLGSLATVFGTQRNAQTVIEYYGDMVRQSYKTEAEASTLADDREAGDDALDTVDIVDTVDTGSGKVSFTEEFGTLTERDAEVLTPTFRDPTPVRPFSRATDRADFIKARRAAPGGSRGATMREYVAQTGDSPQFVAARIRSDLRKRLTAAENRDTETVQGAIAQIEAIPESDRGTELDALLWDLKSRKTETRTDLPKLRRQQTIVDNVIGVPFSEVMALEREVRVAEKKKSPDAAKLRAKLTKIEERFSANSEKMLDKFSVVMTPPNEAAADDNTVAKFRGLLDRLPNANVGSLTDRAVKKEKIAKIKRTALSFTRTDGKKLTLSMETMALNAKAKGTLTDRFLDAFAAMLVRPDIEGFTEPKPDAIVARHNSDKPLLWSDVFPPQFEADTRTLEQRAAARKTSAAKAKKAAAQKTRNDAEDFETRQALMAAIRSVQLDYINSEILAGKSPVKTVVAYTNSLSPVKRLDAKDELSTLAYEKTKVWAKAVQVRSKRARDAGAPDFAARSKERVLRKYLGKQLNERFPMPDEDSLPSRLISENNVTVMPGESDGNKLGPQILDAEARIEVLDERIAEMKDIDFMSRTLIKDRESAANDLNKLGNQSLQGPRALDVNVRGKQELPELKRAEFQAIGAAQRVVLPTTWRSRPRPDLLAKDQAKSDRANKFIGRGSKTSSTFAYMKAWGGKARGSKANTGSYKPTDVVFSSAEGKRAGRISPHWGEYKRAIRAGVTFITDMPGTGPGQRDYSSNIGEQAVAAFLTANGYTEINRSGTWVPLGKASAPRALLQPPKAEKLSADEPGALDVNVRGKRELPESELKRTKASALGDSRPTPSAQKLAADEQAIRDEIRRTRGPKVRVRYERLIKDLGGSGEFSFDNTTKLNRLIEIAMNAANPLGVARHEALHDFFAMLEENVVGRSIKRDLKQAASAPQVKKRLRELLAKHPAALKQIETDPEERAAYMYQFWAEGQIKLGSTGDGMFEKIRNFFRDVFKIVGTADRADQLLSSLQDGKFADPDTVAEVLADLPADRIKNKLDRSTPALSTALARVFRTAPDRLREYQNEKLTELADMFSSEEGTLGFIQRRFQQGGVWENKLAGILEKTTAAERRAAVDNMQAMRDPSNKLERDLRTYLDDMHEYLTKSGVAQSVAGKDGGREWEPIRRVKNYYPRGFDRAAINDDIPGFTELLKKHGKMSDKAVKDLITALTSGTGQMELAENEHALGFTPFMNAVQDRKLTFINKSNAVEFAKYQSKDLLDTLAGYTKQAVHRAEYASMFGNAGEVVTKMIIDSGVRNSEELADIGKVVQGLEGSIGNSMTATTSELMSAVMTLQNLVILPLALFSQMIDPVVMAARSGDLKDAGNAYMTAVKRLVRMKVPGEELANMLGVISQDSVLEAMGNAYGTVHMSARMRNINRVFFRYNGMQGWNNSMRIAATVAGEKYLIANRKDTTALAELGLTPADVKTDKAGKLVVDDPKVVQAMYRFVDSAVLRPSASNRPVWMSDPRFILVSHLKQFTFAMHNVVLKRATQQLGDGNPKPWGILMLAMPTILASDMAKFALLGGPPASWTFMDYMAHAVARSGLLGLGDFAAQVERGVEYGGAPGEVLLGPAFEHLMEGLRWITGDPRTSFMDVVDRTVPGARFI